MSARIGGMQDFSPTRRALLKGLGLLALAALPACRRAQKYAVQPEDCPEWVRPGEATCFATCMPWANGALPMLAVCHDAVPTSLQPNPVYAAHPGLPAFAQAAILDLYDARRMATPGFNGKNYPWEGVQGAFRAWARAIQGGRRTALLLPQGYSPIRRQQCAALMAYGGVKCYAYDTVCTPRSSTFEALEIVQNATVGKPVLYPTGFGSLQELIADMPGIDLLFIFTPTDVAAFHPDFADMLRQTSAETVRFSLFADETSKCCQYSVPQTHFLEEWGAEADAYGNLCLRQPVLRPLRTAVSEADALHALLHDGRLPLGEASHQLPARGWLEKVVDNVPQALKKGFVKRACPLPTPCPTADERMPYVHPFFADGRFLHNRWLQETYDPLSGFAGAPAVYLRRKRMKRPPQDHPVSVQVKQYTLPAQPWPGIPEDLFPLLPGLQHVESPALCKQTYPLVKEKGSCAPTLSSYTAPTAPSPQWGMTIDVSACIGCAACVVACRAENNIPTVGQDEMIRHRDIQWLRIDRYFDAKSNKELFVPMTCRHCEDAPCEAVCPVNATVHTSDGLNAMVYPRCWGTRYCSAACPYQARTFNFHDYARQSHATTHLPTNPDVTVRARGVMEKCTYCVQRINLAKAEGNTPQTACQMACPTQAIKLIDLVKDAPAQVCTSFDAPGTKPHTLYLLNK